MVAISPADALFEQLDSGTGYSANKTGNLKYVPSSQSSKVKTNIESSKTELLKDF